MDASEFVIFLKTLLNKIENVDNFLDQECPKYILAYNKMLGVQQKLNELDKFHKVILINQVAVTRFVINHLINGKYEDAYKNVLKLKKDLIEICISYERNKE